MNGNERPRRWAKIVTLIGTGLAALTAIAFTATIHKTGFRVAEGVKEPMFSSWNAFGIASVILLITTALVLFAAFLALRRGADTGAVRLLAAGVLTGLVPAVVPGLVAVAALILSHRGRAKP